MKLVVGLLLLLPLNAANAQGNKLGGHGGIGVEGHILPSMQVLLNGVPQRGNTFAVPIADGFTIHIDAANWEYPLWDLYATQLAPGAFFIEGTRLRYDEGILVASGLRPFEDRHFSFVGVGLQSGDAETAGAPVLLYLIAHRPQEHPFFSGDWNSSKHSIMYPSAVHGTPRSPICEYGTA